MHSLVALAQLYTDLAVLAGTDYYLGISRDWCTQLGLPELRRRTDIEQARTHLLAHQFSACTDILDRLVSVRNGAHRAGPALTTGSTAGDRLRTWTWSTRSRGDPHTTSCVATWRSPRQTLPLRRQPLLLPQTRRRCCPPRLLPFWAIPSAMLPPIRPPSSPASSVRLA